MDPNNTHEVIFLDNLYKLRPWLYDMCHICVNYDIGLCTGKGTIIATF